MSKQKRILYLSTWDFTNEASDGVCKKIKSQIAVFEKEGIHVDFVYIFNGKILYRKDEVIYKLGKVGNIKKTPAYIKMYKHLKKEKYDYVYNRYGMMDTFYFRLIKKLYKNGAKILIEIPTYPYIGERQKGFAYWLMFKWDEFYSSRLCSIVERIVTYSEDEKIFNIPTIYIINGIETKEIIPKSGVKEDDAINLLAIAYMQPHHGYERLLYGLKKYYDTGGKRKIKCHFVGDGPEKSKYESIVAKNGLEKNAFFYGAKKDRELDEIYNGMDIGVCSLGAYKKGLSLSSELKSREYFAKGLPIVSGVTIDIFRNLSTKYYMQFPNDETIIDVFRLIDFYDEIYRNQNRKVIEQDIRKIAETYMDIGVTMQPVCNYIKENL